MLTRADVQTRLDAFDVRRLSLDEGMRAASVMVVMAPHDGRRGVWLTRRPARMNRHAAQFALPGGRLDDAETHHEAGLRELHEEMGIALGADAILGDLDDYRTRSGFVMTPTVAWMDDEVDPAPNPDEVEHVFLIDLEELAHAEPLFESIPESERPVMSLPLIGRRIHAPTAAVLFQFAAVALRDEPVRVAAYDQPLFAWR
ncbi:CoA pyrophosphatase [Gordonia sp. HY002]|uniref:NUDIX hydrolase n=1 Tax=Gordonia zhenghanii TaxID=2911516 RepID=UPI001EF08004|nr:CoA pyrophosphatase [Gordonia zhenghanii]MCF8568885.1 CoA pyrophosphatase [Gordonia zhenghanii]MCF8602245.1 CoA pyrophosphatase [Gordonia zhenghanii]